MEDNLHDTQSEFDKLRAELKEASEQLRNCAQEKTHLESLIQKARKQTEESALQKKILQVHSNLKENACYYFFLYYIAESYY